jgi:pyroglutamyl-peptidase
LADIARTVHIFPTIYDAVDRDLPKLIAAKPDIVLMFGLAGRRRVLCVETRARNAVSLLFPDASGYRPHRGVIATGGPPSRQGRTPFAHLLSAARNTGLPARLSRDAGRYLCNYVYWRALQHARGGRPLVQFIHIPPARLSPWRGRAQNRAPALGQMVRAAEAVLIALAAASRR